MREKKLIEQIISRYGPVIDLRKNPEVIIDIIRRSEDDPPDGGQPCGGTPPPPPPGPTSFHGLVTNEEIMTEILKLSRLVSKIHQAQAKGRARRG